MQCNAMQCNTLSRIIGSRLFLRAGWKGRSQTVISSRFVCCCSCCCCCRRRHWLVLRVRPIPMRVLIVGCSMICDEEEEEFGSRCTDVSFTAGRDGSKGIDGVSFHFVRADDDDHATAGVYELSFVRMNMSLGLGIGFGDFFQSLGGRAQSDFLSLLNAAITPSLSGSSSGLRFLGGGFWVSSLGFCCSAGLALGFNISAKASSSSAN